jgi:hypothetical protein
MTCARALVGHLGPNTQAIGDPGILARGLATTVNATYRRNTSGIYLCSQLPFINSQIQATNDLSIEALIN